MGEGLIALETPLGEAHFRGFVGCGIPVKMHGHSLVVFTVF